MESHSDPALEEIRETRHQISAEFDHDPQKIVDYYIKLQSEFSSRLISEPIRTEQRPAPLAAPSGVNS